MVAQKSFDYDVVSIKDIQPQVVYGDGKGSPTKRVTTVKVGDTPYQPSDRFWNSLFSRYGFSDSIFKYFTHDEVFDRIADKSPSDQIRVCIEKTDTDPSGTLLAVSNNTKSLIRHSDAMHLLEGKAENISYHNGIVTSTHCPSVDDGFDVLGDSFQNRYSIMTPIDGYGLPNIYLGLMRQVCTNGLVAMSKAFRQSIAVGKNDGSAFYALDRILSGFNNDQGFAALRDRITNAGTSWASLQEADMLYKLLVKIYTDNDGVNAKNTLTAFHNMTGDVGMIYGLANASQLASKRKRTLPVKCTVYDLINFATEISTHYCGDSGRKRLNAFVGDLITNEYDLEGSCSRFKDFADFHLPFNPTLAV